MSLVGSGLASANGSVVSDEPSYRKEDIPVVIVWSGRGYIVPAATFAISLATEYMTETLFADEKYYQKQAWPLSLALMAAAGVCYGVGKRLNRATTDSRAQPSIAPPAGRAHTFFFVRMELWGPILAAIALVSFFVRSLR